MNAKSTASAHDASTSESSVFTHADEAWSEVSRLGQGAYRLRLGGSFRSAWMATLCTGLGARRLSIQTAHARRGPDAGWIAELGFVALPGAVDALHLPYVDMARTDVEHAPAPLSLDACSVAATGDHGGSLLLKLETDDELGILGSVLASLATLMLFPVEMHIETRHGRAYDSLWLAGMSGAQPSARAHAALQQMVQRWVHPPPG
jgi:hypothetical protein